MSNPNKLFFASVAALLEANRLADLYFVTDDNAVILLPRDWSVEFRDPSGEGDVYCWLSGPDVNNWLRRTSREWLTTDAQGWIPVAQLLAMRTVSEVEARSIAPDLFRLLDAVNTGSAV